MKEFTETYWGLDEVPVIPEGKGWYCVARYSEPERHVGIWARSKR